MLVNLYETDFSAGKTERKKIGTISVMTFNRRNMVRSGDRAELSKIDATMAAVSEIAPGVVVEHAGKFYVTLYCTVGASGYYIHFLSEVNE